MGLLDLARLAVLAITLLLAAAALALAGISLGLDLQGGTRLEYTLGGDAALGDDALLRAGEVVASRLDAAGLDATVLTRDGAILVDLASDDAESLEAAHSVLAVGGRLGLLEVDDTWTGPSAARDAAGILVSMESQPTGMVPYLAARGPDARARLLAAAAREPMPTPDHALLVGPSDDGARTYLVQRRGGIDGAHVVDAEVTYAYGAPQILIRFDAEGASALEALTARLIGRRLAIVLDDEVLSAPVVMDPIAGGTASISLGPDAEPDEALALGHALRSGALPAPLVLESEQRMGATIGVALRWGALLALLVVWLAVTAAALLRFRLRAVTVALGMPLTGVIALAIYCVALGGTLTGASFAAIACGTLVSAALSTALLEGGARSWRATPFVVLALAVAAVLTTSVTVHLATGPGRAFAAALGAALVAATLVAFTLAASATPRPPRAV